MNTLTVSLLIVLASGLSTINVSSKTDGSFETALNTAQNSAGAIINLATGTGPYTLPGSFAVPNTAEITLTLNSNTVVVTAQVGVSGKLTVQGPGAVSTTSTPPASLFLLDYPSNPTSCILTVTNKVTFSNLKTTVFTVSLSTLSITDCDFKGSISPIILLSSLNSMLSLSQSRISSNSGPYGVIIIKNTEAESQATGQFNILDCTFSSNTATTGSTLNFVPVTAAPASNTMLFNLQRSTFADMFAYSVIVTGMRMVVNECSFTTEALAVNADGMSFPVTVSNSRFIGGGVGILGGISGAMTVENCHFTDGQIGILAQGSGASSLTVRGCYLSGLNNQLSYPVASGITGYGVASVFLENTLLEDMKGAIAALMMIQGSSIFKNVTVQRVYTHMNGILSLVASYTNITESTFRNVSSLDPIALQYGSQLIINTSLVENVDAQAGSIISGEFNEFSTFHSTYRNLNCTYQVFKIHTLLSPVSFGWIDFYNINATSLIFDELQGGSFESCNFYFTETSSEMTLYIISGKPVTMYNCFLTGSIKLLVDGESTEGEIPFINVTLRNVRTDGLLSSLQFTITILNSVFENVVVLNAQRYLINLA